MDLPPKEETRPEPEPQTEAAPQAPQPPAPAPKQAKIDAPPAPKRTIKPDYPRGSRQRGEEGEVTLAIEVGADGLVLWLPGLGRGRPQGRPQGSFHAGPQRLQGGRFHGPSHDRVQAGQVRRASYRTSNLDRGQSPPRRT